MGSHRVFEFWDIVFPQTLPFFSTFLIDMIFLINTHRNTDFGQRLWVAYSINSFNVVYLAVQFLLMFIFEIWKMRFAPECYYGFSSTSKASEEERSN